MIAFAPSTVQWIPGRFKRVPTEYTQHYPPRRPSRGGHDHPRASPAGDSSSGGRARLPPWQAGIAAPNSRRQQAIRPGGMDRCRQLGATPASACQQGAASRLAALADYRRRSSAAALGRHGETRCPRPVPSAAAPTATLPSTRPRSGLGKARRDGPLRRAGCRGSHYFGRNPGFFVRLFCR